MKNTKKCLVLLLLALSGAMSACFGSTYIREPRTPKAQQVEQPKALNEITNSLSSSFHAKALRPASRLDDLLFPFSPKLSQQKVLMTQESFMRQQERLRLIERSRHRLKLIQRTFENLDFNDEREQTIARCCKFDDETVDDQQFKKHLGIAFILYRNDLYHEERSFEKCIEKINKYIEQNIDVESLKKILAEENDRSLDKLYFEKEHDGQKNCETCLPLCISDFDIARELFEGWKLLKVREDVISKACGKSDKEAREYFRAEGVFTPEITVDTSSEEEFE